MAKIRLWTLGSLKHNILPNPKAAENLKKIIENLNNSTEEWFDIIWGEDLQINVIDEEVARDVVLMDKLCITYLESKGYNIIPPTLG